MRRKIAMVLALALMMGAMGCDKQGTSNKTETPVDATTEDNVVINDEKEVSEDGGEETTEETKKEESVEQEKVTITFDGKNDDRFHSQ